MAFLSDKAIDKLEQLGVIPPSCCFVRIYGKPMDWRVEYGVNEFEAWHKAARDPRPPTHVLRAWQDWLIEGGVLSEDCCEADLIFKRGEPARVIATNFLPQRFLDAMLRAR